MVVGSLTTYWIGFSISLLTTIFASFLLFVNKEVKGLRDLIAGLLIISFLSFLNNLTLILDQGYIQRSDFIIVEWSRFAYLIAITLFLTLMIAKYLWHELIFRWTALVSLILSTTLLLFSVISTHAAIYTWGILSFVTLIFGLLIVLLFSKKKDYYSFILIGLIVISVLSYLIMIILSPANTNVISWSLFDWIIVFTDCILLIAVPIIIILTYTRIPCSCLEKSEECCQMEQLQLYNDNQCDQNNQYNQNNDQYYSQNLNFTPENNKYN